MTKQRDSGKYPADVMRPYDAGWRSYSVCGMVLFLMIVTVVTADALHAGQSVADIAVLSGLFLIAGIYYVRGVRQMRDFQRRAREYRLAHSPEGS